MADLPANRDATAREHVGKLRQEITEIATSLATVLVLTDGVEKAAKEAKQISRAVTGEEKKLDSYQPFDYTDYNDLVQRVQLLRPQAASAMADAQQYSSLGALCMRYGVGRVQIGVQPGTFTLTTNTLSMITASNLTELRVRLEQALASEQRKHDEYSADVKADLQQLLKSFEQVDTSGYDDYRLTQYRELRAELHDIQLNFERANETVSLDQLHQVERDVRAHRINLRSRVLRVQTDTAPAVTSQRRRPWAVLGAGTVAVLTSAASGLGLATGLLEGGLVAAGVLVPAGASALWGATLARRSRSLQQQPEQPLPALPAQTLDPETTTARELPAPEAWTKRTLRVLETQAPSWAAALSPQRAAQLNSLLDEARLTLTSGSVLSAGQIQQEELRRLLEDHLPTSLDSFLQLRMSIPANRLEGDAELDRQLGMILIDLRRIADLSDEAVLSRQREFGRYLDSALAISELNLHQPPKIEG